MKIDKDLKHFKIEDTKCIHLLLLVYKIHILHLISLFSFQIYLPKFSHS